MRTAFFRGLLLLLAFGLADVGHAAPPDIPAKKPTDPRCAVLIDNVGDYLKQADVPKRKGLVTFDGKITEKDGKKVVEATHFYSINGFSMSYHLAGVIKPDRVAKKELNANDLASITIRYTDDWLEAKGLTERDVKGLIEQLDKPDNKVRVGAVIVPGGEMLEFSPPMKKLMILGEKARAPLQACLGDQRIQNEVALILGAIGDETTVPALIQVYPEGDLREAKQDGPEHLKGVCLTFALTYLTGQPIGRSREGADLEPGNGKLWKDWWAREGKTFKVPAKKPAESWVPLYPILTEKWAARCRKEFSKEEERKQ